MSASVVVTGASGFLGGAVVRALRAETKMKIVPVSRRPLAGGVQVRDYDETPQADILIHLANESDRARAAAGGDPYVKESARIVRSLLAKSYRCVLYASSAALYGDQVARPRRPEEPVFPSDPYGQAKREGERLILETGRGIALRLGNLYGVGMSRANVLSAILSQIHESEDKPLKIGDDSPIRDFLWIEDAAQAFARIAAQAVAKTEGGIYNLGSGVGTSVGALARLALDLAGHSQRRVVASDPSGRPSVLVLDIAATIAAFGWRPETDLKKGLAALIPSF